MPKISGERNESDLICLVRRENTMDIYERLKRVVTIEPGCFIGERCAMNEIAHDALVELAGKDSVIKALHDDIREYRKDWKDQMIQDQGVDDEEI